MHTKIIIMLLAASMAALSGYGQTEKGTTILGLSYSPSFKGKYQPTRHERTFRAGHFFKNNLMLGAESSYSRYDIGDFYDSQQLSVGLTGRYYFNIKSPRLKFFMLAGAGYRRDWGSYFLSATNTEPATTHPFSRSDLYLKLGAGASYQVSKHFSLETNFEQQFIPFSKNQFGDANLNFGLNYHFGNKKKK